jgi:hypothetical protein
MPSVEERLSTLEEQLVLLRESQEAINLDVAKMPESLALNFRVLSRAVTSRFDAQDRKLASMDAKLAAMDAKFDAKTDALAADVSAILKILGEHFGPTKR